VNGATPDTASATAAVTSSIGGMVGSARNHGNRVTVACRNSAGCTAQNGTASIGSWNGVSAAHRAGSGRA
jgi:hypothetical protein